MSGRHGEATFVVDEGDLRKYRTEIPNMVLDMGLDPYTLTLYGVLKRIAGDTGVCWAGTRFLAKAANMSVGMVVKCKAELVRRGLIRVVEHPRESGLADDIHIADVWPANFEHFACAKTAKPRSSREHPPVHAANTPRSSREHKKKPSEQRTKETSPNGDAKKPAPASSSRGRKTVSKLSEDEAERHWNAVCQEDPNGDSLRRMAQLLAAERKRGQVAITTVWSKLGERYQKARKRETLSEKAWAHGFDEAISREKPSIRYVLVCAQGYRPDRRTLRSDALVAIPGGRGADEDPYAAGGY